MRMFSLGALPGTLARRRTTLWAAVALLGAVCTLVSLHRYLGWLRSQIPAGGLVAVVVAARDIEAGAVIESGMVRTAGLPRAAAPRTALRSTRMAVGSTAAVALDQGQALTDRSIGRAGPSALVPRGMRAFDLAADIVAGSALTPRQGDRVDVIATFAGDGSPQEARSTTVLRWRAVAAFASGGEGSASMGAGPGFGDVAGPVSPGRITLLVTPEEAERLAMAESFGRIRVVLASALPDAAWEQTP